MDDGKSEKPFRPAEYPADAVELRESVDLKEAPPEKSELPSVLTARSEDDSGPPITPAVRPDTAPILPLPARARKRRYGQVVTLSTVFYALPFIALIVCTFTNPATVPYLCGALHGFKVGTLPFYNDALKLSRSPDILQARADLLEACGDAKNQGRDLRELVKDGVKNGCNYTALATQSFGRNGENAETVNLLRQAAKISAEHCRSQLAAFFPDTNEVFADNRIFSTVFALMLRDNDQYKRPALDLVACGDYKTGLDICREMKGSAAHPDLYLEALARREAGDSVSSSKLVDAIELNYDHGFADWSDIYNLRALCRLDKGDLKGAARVITEGKKAEWNVEAAEAWLLYDLGFYDQAIKRTTHLTKLFEETSPSYQTISGIQMQAANQLLHANLLLKLKRPAEAKHAFLLYQAMSGKGKVFIPMPHRDLIEKAAQMIR